VDFGKLEFAHPNPVTEAFPQTKLGQTPSSPTPCEYRYGFLTLVRAKGECSPAVQPFVPTPRFLRDCGNYPRDSSDLSTNMTPFENAFVAHLIGDWLLQNDWMARNKCSLRHPASWVHGAIHGVLLGIVLGWWGGVALGLAHMLVDTRVPQGWWARIYGQTISGPSADHVLVWADQVIHIGMIAVWLHVAPSLSLG